MNPVGIRMPLTFITGPGFWRINAGAFAIGNDSM
jgi:hypothetical protein